LKPKEECRLPVARASGAQQLLRGMNLLEVTLRDEPELPDARVQRPVDDQTRPRAKRSGDALAIETAIFSRSPER
jgi:hypothetical protein